MGKRRQPALAEFLEVHEPLGDDFAKMLYLLRDGRPLTMRDLRWLLDFIVSEARDMQGCKHPDTVDDLREIIDRAGKQIGRRLR